MNTQDFFTYQMNQHLLNSAALIEECSCCEPITNGEMLATLGWSVIFLVVIGFVTLVICLAMIWVMDKFSKWMD